MKIESSFSPIKDHVPMFLHEDTLEGFGLKTNFFPTKELAFELISHIVEVEKPVRSLATSLKTCQSLSTTPKTC